MSSSSIPFQFIQKAGKTKKPGTNTELSILFSFFAFRFFSADIDGDDPLCYDMGSERENNEIWLVRFYSDNRTNDESLVSRQAHAPQTLSKVNPRKAMMFQMFEIQSFFRSSLMISIVE